MAESYSVKAILSAVDTNFSSTMKKADRMVNNFSKGYFNTMKKIGKYSAIAGMAMSGYAIKAGADFEAGMSKVKAISKANKKQMADLTALAEKMGRETQFSATQSAEALKYMAMAGWKTDKMLKGLPGVMNLAAAGGEDLATTSDIVTDTMTALGMKADEAEDFANAMAVGFANTNTNVATMGESFKYAGNVAGTLGYSVEDTAMALGLMANNGVKGSMAGTSLRRALTNLTKPSKSAREEMERLGISMNNSDGSLRSLHELMVHLRSSFKGLTRQQQMQSAATIFGQQAYGGMLSIIRTTDEDFDKLTKRMSNTKDAAKDMATIMNDNLHGDFKKLKSAIEGVSIQLYKVFGGSLRGVVQDMTKFVNSLNKGVDGLKEFMEELGKAGSTSEKIDLISKKLEPIKPLLSGLGSSFAVAFSAPYISKFSKKILKLPASLDKMSTSMSASMKKFNEKSATGFKNASSKFNGFMKKFPELNKKYITATTRGKLFSQKMSYNFSTMSKNVGEKIGLTSKRLNFLGKGMQTGLSKGKAFTGGMLKILGGFAKASMMILAPAAIFATFVVGLGFLYQKFGGKIDEMIKLAVTKGPLIIRRLVDGITSRIPNLMSAGTKMISGLADVIAANLPELAKGGVKIIKSLIKGLSDNMNSLVKSAVKITHTITNTIIDTVPELILAGAELIESFSKGILDNIDLITDNAKKTINNFTSKIKEYLPKIIDTGLNILSNLVDGFVKAIPKIIPAISNMITTFISTISDKLPDILDKGFEIIVNLIRGIVDALPDILSAAAKIIGSLVKAIVSNLPHIIVTGLKLIAALVVGLLKALPSLAKAGFELIWNIAKGILLGIPESLGKVWKAVTGFFGKMWNWITGKGDEGAGAVVDDFDYIEGRVTGSTERTTRNATEQANTLHSNMTGAYADLRTDTNAIITDMERNHGEKMSNIANMTEDEMYRYVNSVETGANNAKTAFDSSTGAMTESAFDAKYNVTQAGYGMRDGLREGSQGMARDSERTSDDVKGAFRMAQTLNTIGYNSGIGMYSGLQDGVRGAYDYAWRTSDNIKGAFRIGGSLNAIGYNSGVGFYNGFNSIGRDIVDRAYSIANSVISTMSRVLRIGSPSRVLTQIGAWTGEGFAIGLDKSNKLVEKASKKLSETAVIDSISSKARNIGLSHTVGIEGAIESPNSQPANITLHLGKRTLKAFVEDISNVQNGNTELALSYT